MKTYTGLRNRLAVVVGMIVLVFAVPVARAELIIADDFPIAGVEASQIRGESVFDQLLSAYEEDTVPSDEDLYEELEEIILGY